MLTRLRRRLAQPLGVAALFLLFPLALYSPVLFGGRTLVPYDALLTDPLYRPLLEDRGIRAAQNDLVADLVFENRVWKTYWADAVHEGELPLWSPYLFGGTPFLAAGQHSGLYPPTLLFLFLPIDLAFGWNAVLALWLAGLGMYLLGRQMRLARFAALIMGLSWQGSSLFVVNTVFPMIQGAMAWTPFILAGIQAVILAVTRPSDRRAHDWLPRGRLTGWLVLIALATAMTALAGHVEALYYAAIVSAAFAVFGLFGIWRRFGVGAALRAGLWLGGAAAAGALVAAGQLVPLAELAGTNWRSGAESYATIVGYAFGLRQAITFLLPDFYGNPAHHAVWDLARRGPVALTGHAMWGTAWGTKNYVEAAGYVGILPLLLAALGVASARRRGSALFWAVLGAVALTFVFGLPTYRLLFFGLPGFDQLHTPFRWIFPFALATVVLAGIGADRLVGAAVEAGEQAAGGNSAASHTKAGHPSPPAPRIPQIPRVALAAGWLAAGLGTALVAALGLVAGLRPEAWTGVVEQTLLGAGGLWEAASVHFPSKASFASYTFWNLWHLAIFLTLSGTALLALARARTPRGRRAAMALAAAAVWLDLFLVGFGFNPAVDRRLAQIQPELVATLHQLTDLSSGVKWGRVVGYGDAKVLWPNSAMQAGIPEVRGYDSIIPRWNVETLNAIQPQGEGGTGMLKYNRIGNLTKPEALESPVLAALGGRYILTKEKLDADPILRLVQEIGGVRLYENLRALPRAWVVNQVRVISDRTALVAALGGEDPPFKPDREVLLEEAPRPDLWRELPTGRPIRPAADVRMEAAGRNQLQLDVFTDQAGMLVVSEAWFPGWKATIKAGGGTAEAVEVPVYRADGMLRAVPVPAGRSTVNLVYSPLSVKLGLYGSFLGLILLFLAVVYALWDRFVRVDEGDAVGRIAVNTAGPMAAALLGKVLDFAFQMLALRILGPGESGLLAVAVALVTLVDIVSNFGLNLLVAREVSREPDSAPRYLTHTAILRLILLGLAAPVIAAYIALLARAGDPLPPTAVLALWLFLVGLIPSTLNAAISSLFQARERMVLPAGVSIVSTLAKVSLGALALTLGYGIVGLAFVSIVTNWITFGILAILAVQHGIRPSGPISRTFLWAMVGLSWPLMLNHLLQHLFFKTDVLILERYWPNEVVGWYGAAYKWIDALLIVPAYSVMALFPLLSRRAAHDRVGMERAYATALRWLLSLAVPIAVATTFLAEPLIGLLAGAEYLPHGARALQILIWFLPLSYANGLIQYVLISLGRARWITISFAVAATFNIVTNLIVIPRFAYPGAAAVTIATEAVLMLPFLYGLRDLNAPTPLELLWRPSMAATAMILVIGGAFVLELPIPLGVLVAVPTYVVALRALGGITAGDLEMVGRVRGPTAD